MWKIDGKIKHFVLTVLPVGLNSVSFMLGKIDRLLVNYWSKNILKVVCFLDDSLSLVKLFFEATPSSHFVQQTLQKSKFIVNVKKPI